MLLPAVHGAGSEFGCSGDATAEGGSRPRARARRERRHHSIGTDGVQDPLRLGACHADAPSRCLATWAPRVSVPPSIALTRPPTAQIGHAWPWVEMPLEGVPEECSGARARRGRRRHWYGGRRGPPGACHADASLPPSNVGTPSERSPIGPRGGAHRMGMGSEGGRNKVHLGRATRAADPAVWPASPTRWTSLDGRDIEHSVLLTTWATQYLRPAGAEMLTLGGAPGGRFGV